MSGNASISGCVAQAALLMLAVASCDRAEAPVETDHPADVEPDRGEGVGPTRASLLSWKLDGAGALFGHSWLDCEFGRFTSEHTEVEAQQLPDGTIEVKVSGDAIPTYEATFWFHTSEAGEENCDVKVWWMRDSGFDHELSGYLTGIDAAVWVEQLDFRDGEIATRLSFRITGLREGEPVTVSGEGRTE